MIRILFLLIVLLFAGRCVPQTGWAPLSREVERPYAPALEAFKSEVHTAIRPLSAGSLRGTIMNDSLLPSAAIRTLDKWAGRMNGRKFRWGPLLEANGGYTMGDRSDPVYRGSAGFWTDLDAGPKLTFHLDAQGWGERLPNYLDTLAKATQVTAGEGYAYGTSSDIAHYDWSGYVSWDAHKYINLTMGKGKNSFGNGHRSLFLSSEAYSYPYLKITTSVWHIQYVNLFTMMNDIRGADGRPAAFRTKYSSMHYLSWNASRRINVAVFEAIMWSAGDANYPRGFDITYLNPIIFYRPSEFQIGSPDNALLGLAVNVKAGKHVLFYGQLMLDEFLMARVREGLGWYANKQAIQLGVNAHKVFGVDGLHMRGEWNLVRPFMYTHSDTRQNYSHMAQPLAHPYGSNLQEALAQVDLTRDRWVYSARASMAWLGEDSVASYGSNIFRPESDRPRRPDNKPQDLGYRIGQLRQGTLFQAEVGGGYTIDPRSAMRLELNYIFRMADGAATAPETEHVVRLGLSCYFRERHPEQLVRYIIN